MTQQEGRRTLIKNSNIREHFHQSLDNALKLNAVSAAQETVLYLVELLVHFLRSDRLFETTEEGLRIRPLALHYLDAVEGTTSREREQALRRLGDIALFVAGVFTDSFERKPVDVDYYVAMGGSAYGYLAEGGCASRRGRALAPTFAELSAKFTDFVDVLADLSDHALMQRNANILRLYEIWLRTGSRRAARRLRALGIEPLTEIDHRARH